MNKETFYGIDGFTRRNDGHAFGNPTSSAGGAKEDVPGLKKIAKEQEHLDLHNSNPRLDKFLFYYCSKL